MEALLKAIAANPERFTEAVYLPCPLRQLAEALNETSELNTPESAVSDCKRIAAWISFSPQVMASLRNDFSSPTSRVRSRCLVNGPSSGLQYAQ